MCLPMKKTTQANLTEYSINLPAKLYHVNGRFKKPQVSWNVIELTKEELFCGPVEFTNYVKVS